MVSLSSPHATTSVPAFPAVSETWDFDDWCSSSCGLRHEAQLVRFMDKPYPSTHRLLPLLLSGPQQPLLRVTRQKVLLNGLKQSPSIVAGRGYCCTNRNDHRPSPRGGAPRRYEAETGRRVEGCRFRVPRDDAVHGWLGASPDGLIAALQTAPGGPTPSRAPRLSPAYRLSG